MCNTDDVDCEQLSKELVRALRGKRSQAQLSRLLGYRSNVVFDWESGRRFPRAVVLFELARKVGLQPDRLLPQFHRAASQWPRNVAVGTPQGLGRLMNELRGKQAIQGLADRCDCSRFVVGRWLSGRSQPRLPEFLRYVEASSLRLLDFVALFVPPDEIACVGAGWQQLTLARELAYSEPWSQAVLRVLESEQYHTLPQHRQGFIAQRLGISIDEENHCLRQLVRANEVRLRKGKFQLRTSGTVDTRTDPKRSRELRAFWTRVAANRLLDNSPGEFAFNLCGVSNADLERLYALQRDYFQQLRSIVAQSQPVQQVVLVNLQVLPLSST